MELLYLRAYGSGYRGCVIQSDGYLFFQCSRKSGLKKLKGYPKTDFDDLDHFKAMMQKFITPPSFLKPPIAITALSMEELDRAHAQIKAQRV
jgi:hypothetical protein